MKRQHSLRSLFVFTPAIGARCHGLIIPHAATTPAAFSPSTPGMTIRTLCCIAWTRPCLAKSLLTHWPPTTTPRYGAAKPPCRCFSSDSSGSYRSLRARRQLDHPASEPSDSERKRRCRNSLGDRSLHPASIHLLSTCSPVLEDTGPSPLQTVAGPSVHCLGESRGNTGARACLQKDIHRLRAADGT